MRSYLQVIFFLRGRYGWYLVHKSRRQNEKRKEKEVLVQVSVTQRGEGWFKNEPMVAYILVGSNILLKISEERQIRIGTTPS